MAASNTQIEAAPHATQALETLYDASTGTELPLTHELAQFYGALRFPLQQQRPYVIANLVTSLDGVVSLGIPGKAGGKEISGFNLQDRVLMGLLRAAADAVVVGAGTLREGRGHPLTGAGVYPPLRVTYATFRTALNKEEEPLAVVVTASGHLDPSMQLFRDKGSVLVVTTSRGARHAQELGLGLGGGARVVAVESEGPDSAGSISAGAVLDAIRRVRNCDIVLVEGGPHLLGDFYSEGLIDEQFLTLSPQFVGRDSPGRRLGLVEGRTFAPERPLWGRLSVVKRGESHLFLRYLIEHAPAHQGSTT